MLTYFIIYHVAYPLNIFLDIFKRPFYLQISPAIVKRSQVSRQLFVLYSDFSSIQPERIFLNIKDLQRFSVYSETIVWRFPRSL